MSKSISWLCLGVFASLFSGFVGVPAASAQTGSFFAVLNESNNNGDSRRSVSYFDASDFASGPLFSVFIGYEANADFEEMGMIDVNPATGDVYVLSFDSGDVPGPDPDAPSSDTSADLDLYRIDFSTVFDHWTTNFKGKNVRTLGGALAVGGIAPTGSKNAANTDYVTYGPNNPFDEVFPFNANHSNTFVLPGVTQKIGEIKRNLNTDGSPFFPFSLEFIDQDTLFLLDDSSATTVTDTAATDHEYRVIKRVSTSPGLATGAADHLDGGFNLGAAESWESRRIGLVNLDFDGGGTPIGHSEPESTAYYADSASGVRGVWVTESDGGGDTVAFLQLDPSTNNSLGYRMLSTGFNSFALDNDPAASTSTNDGKSDKIFVDKDSGDVLIVESGFGDTTGGIGLGDIEPSVLRLKVNSYDNGGAIDLGVWDAKVTLAPTKTPGDTQLERGQWSAWDSANDRMYFINPGATAETPAFEADITYIDMKAGSPTFGQTFSFLDLDDSVSLFNSDSFGDKVAAFTLGAAPAEDADFDNDDDVDGSDFLIWQRGFGVGNNNATGDANGNGVVDAADLAIWNTQFGVAAVATAGAVPEPTSLAMGALGCLAAVAASRRRRLA
jgi:hypothetical protein